MNKALTNTTCYHCGDVCGSETTVAGEKTFCCNGCKSVYEILHQNELDNYYCLNEAPGQSRKKTVTQKFDFLNEPVIADKLITFKNADITRVSFHLPQMHCSSCLWLLENLAKVNDGIVTSQVNFTRKEISLSFNNDRLTLKDVAELLSSIGYEPHLSLSDLEKGKEQKKDNRSAIYKLGIAGFCFANIMLLSFPEYLGLTPENDPILSQFFRWLNVGLSIPVFFYCAQEFFINSFYSFRQKYLNIDAPIALAILVTYSRSLFEVFTQTGAGYFDSMSGIVFFMLVGRAVQNRVHSNLKFNRDYKSYFPIAVTIRTDKTEHVKMVQDVKVNDQILLQHNEIVPVDSFFSKGNGVLLDYSFITGESAPVSVNKGDIVYAGARVLNGNVELVAIKSFSQNNFTQLWNNPVFSKAENDKDAGYTHISKYFSLIVFIIAGAAFAYWYPILPGRAWNALTAVLIIACPCALLLTASFTYGFLIEMFSKKGFFVKNAVTIDSLAKINSIVFDKTGTLTEVNSLKAKRVLQHWSQNERNIALSLMAISSHPVSKAVIKAEEHFENTEIENFKDVPGSGIEAWVGDVHYKIGKAEFVANENLHVPIAGTTLFVYADNRLLAYYFIENVLRPGTKTMFEQLKGTECYLLSGDNAGAKKQMEMVFPENAQLVFDQKPNDKLEFVAALQQKGKTVLMVGDGLNDAGALKQSNVGVAVLENSFAFTPGCDGILEADNVRWLPNYLSAARKSRLLIFAGLAYSVIYNLIGIYFSVKGLMEPMIAAILMPLSSLGIILLSYLGTNYISKRF